MDKAPDAFRTISEVAEDLDLPQHVLRFWETRFNNIKPLKRGGGRRYYRPDDIDLLRGIRHLLYGKGYTIKGVQRILKDEGVKFVQSVWKDGAPAPRSEAQPASFEPVPQPVADVAEADPAPRPERYSPPDQVPRPAVPVDVRPLTGSSPLPAAQASLRQMPQNTQAVLAQPRHGHDPADAVPSLDKPQPAPRSIVGDGGIRRLQAALYELGECRRVLMNARTDPEDA